MKSAAAWAPLLLLVLAPGCAAEVALPDEPVAEAAGLPGEGDPACSGSDPGLFCDDCNPCTADANCTPCSTLPEEQRDIHHCTADHELPAFCEGKDGCVHVPLTTAAGESNSCFPVAGADDPHPGICRAGLCID